MNWSRWTVFIAGNWWVLCYIHTIDGIEDKKKNFKIPEKNYAYVAILTIHLNVVYEFDDVVMFQTFLLTINISV